MNSLPANELLRVAGWEDVSGWGWTPEHLLDVLISLDYDVMEGLTEAAEGHRSQWSPVFLRYPDTWRLLVKAPGEIVGYWHFVPLVPDLYERSKAGQLLDSEITCSGLLPFERPGLYDIYIVTVALRAECRGGYATLLLLKSLLDVFAKLAEHGILIREVCTNAYTQQGEQFFRRLGFVEVQAHEEHGAIFCVEFSKWLRTSAIVQGHNALQRAYQRYASPETAS